ncbi:MAG: DUF932 domain-containing protein [Bacteroidales bacterium]|nr:DUF932 domain-containing protein [Bacteroidales bacterium]
MENILNEAYAAMYGSSENAPQTTYEGNTNVNVSVAEPAPFRNAGKCKSYSTPVTVSEAIKEVGGDYTVEKRSLVAIPNDLSEALKDNQPSAQTTLSKNDIITSHMATVRTDTNEILGVVGSGYGVVQNESALEFFNHILNGDVSGAEKAVIETAGILNDGARFYISARMGTDIMMPGDNSPIEDYILLFNSHDGSGSVQVVPSFIRVICQNTLTMALKQARCRLTYRHTSKVNERMDLTSQENFERAAQVLRFHESYRKHFIEDLERLKRVQLEWKQIQDLSASVFATPAEMKEIRTKNYDVSKVDDEILSTRKKNQIISLQNAVESGIGQDTNRGTGLWLFNGLTTWAQNEKKYQNATAKFDSIMDGDISRKRQELHDNILALAA